MSCEKSSAEKDGIFGRRIVSTPGRERHLVQCDGTDDDAGKEVSSPPLATFQFTAKCRHKTAPPSLPGSTITQSGSGGGGEEKEIFPVIGRWRKHSFPINCAQQMIPKRQRSIPFGSSQSH
ncbi:hypothetical protein TNCT_538701 [Trichonephila clavata]|uniref:Uncharacterized protein n=1 Tax=Trichonephila clavata TaxID=2740835 RepID=A0A8X6HNN6_TRICU|nr:hypothetical protein TNCT_538701 [Trichonephila clavata]